MKAKTILLGGALLCSAAMAFGQVRVDNQGNLRADKDLKVDGNLTANGSLNAKYKLTVGTGQVPSFIGGAQLFSGVYKSPSSQHTSGNSTGIYGEAHGTYYHIMNPVRHVGVFGYASSVLSPGGTQDLNALVIGVAGAVDNKDKHIAIAGFANGTSTISAKLINGIYAGYFEGNVYVKGTLTANSVYSSDERLKTSMLSLGSDKVMDKLMLLKPITYKLKQMETELDSLNAKGEKVKFTVKRYDEKAQEFQKKHYGLVAQELQKVYPDLVYESGDGYLAVNYVELVPLLLQAIQEQQKAIEELQKRLPAYDVATPVADGKEVNTKKRLTK